MGLLCATCNLMPATYGKYCIIHAQSSPVKNKVRIKPVSDKAAEKDKQYNKDKRSFLKEKPLCEMCEKNPDYKKVKKSTCIHHVYRRVGAAKTDVNTWLASCEPCNLRVETHPDWATEYGFIATQEQLTAYYKKHGKQL